MPPHNPSNESRDSMKATNVAVSNRFTHQDRKRGVPHKTYLIKFFDRIRGLWPRHPQGNFPSTKSPTPHPRSKDLIQKRHRNWHIRMDSYESILRPIPHYSIVMYKSENSTFFKSVCWVFDWFCFLGSTARRKERVQNQEREGER